MKIFSCGKVIEPGRTLTVCAGEVRAIAGEEERLIAVIQATMIRLGG